VGAYERAIGVLNKYQVWDKVPESVRRFLLKADPRYLPPTQADIGRRPYFVYRVIGPESMLAAAQSHAFELGLNATILSTSLNDVEASSMGEIFADIAQEAEYFGRPLKPPCVFICGGEAVVAIGQEKGIGGRNQEFVLSAAPRISSDQNIVIGSVDSDGTDGPTTIAGGIVDGFSIDRISQTGINLAKELRHHNSSPVLQAINDAIIIGNTGTNLRDLRVVYVGK
jgi:glycerate-2-kinase